MPNQICLSQILPVPTTHSAVKFQAITDTFDDLPIHQFRAQSDIHSIKVFCDADHDGFSTANLTLVTPTPVPGPTSTATPPHAPLAPPDTSPLPLPLPLPPCPGHPYALFHGTISIDLPPKRPDIHRSGYAAFRTYAPRPTLFGLGLIDIDPYAYLALRINSDGSRYFVNLQTDSIVPTDIHQHRLLAETPGEWETVYIPFTDFVRTNNGTPVQPRDMLRSKLKTVGIGLIDRVPGPYKLAVDRIWVSNVLSP